MPQNQIRLEYPIRYLIPTTGTFFAANVSNDKLHCFGNIDYSEPSYRQVFLCMIPFSDILFGYFIQCDSIFSSRSVTINVEGSVEFIKVNKLPTETVIRSLSISNNNKQSLLNIDDVEKKTISMSKLENISGLRWQQISPTSTSQDVVHIAAEPLYLCARSNDWTRHLSTFRMDFRPVYERLNDKFNCTMKTVIHLFVVVLSSSAPLLPYIASIFVSILTYYFVMNKFILYLVFSFVVILFTPFMFLKDNQRMAKLYIKYFFDRKQAQETKNVIRERLPLFQSIYFSSLLVFIGSLSTFCISYMLNIDREIRNAIIKFLISIASSWFTFFFCRSFDRFFRKWSWIILSISLVQHLDKHLNPMSKDEAIVAILLITFLVHKFTFSILTFLFTVFRIHDVVRYIAIQIKLLHGNGRSESTTLMMNKTELTSITSSASVMVPRDDSKTYERGGTSASTSYHDGTVVDPTTLEMDDVNITTENRGRTCNIVIKMSLNIEDITKEKVIDDTSTMEIVERVKEVLWSKLS